MAWKREDKMAIASMVDQTELARLLSAIPNGREIVISRLDDGEFVISRMIACEPMSKRLTDWWYAGDEKQAASTICLSIFEAEQEGRLSNGATN